MLHDMNIARFASIMSASKRRFVEWSGSKVENGALQLTSSEAVSAIARANGMGNWKWKWKWKWITICIHMVV